MADTSVFGQQDQASSATDYNALNFMILQALNKIQTVTLVKIAAVTNQGGVTPVGFVDVIPMVNQMSGDRQAVPHITIYNIPYFRLQGGKNAIIIDPEVGDIGICGFASRDISAVKSAKDFANPGSFRVFDWADGLYWGGVLNATPEQYVQFSTAGIVLHSPTKIRMEAPEIEIHADNSIKMDSDMLESTQQTSAKITAPNITLTGATEVAGTLSQTGGGASTMSGTVDAAGEGTFNGHTVGQHTHTQGADSHGDAEQPTNPPTG